MHKPIKLKMKRAKRGGYTVKHGRTVYAQIQPYEEGFLFHRIGSGVGRYAPTIERAKQICIESAIFALSMHGFESEVTIEED